jgi:hypothetical protein
MTLCKKSWLFDAYRVLRWLLGFCGLPSALTASIKRIRGSFVFLSIIENASSRLSPKCPSSNVLIKSEEDNESRGIS